MVPKTFSRAPTYAGPRPGWVFTTRAGRTGYWVDGEATGIELFSNPTFKNWERYMDILMSRGCLAPTYRGPGYLPGCLVLTTPVSSLNGPRP